MKMIEIESTVDKEEQLLISAQVLSDMGLVCGDTVKLAYICESPDSVKNTYREFVITLNGIDSIVDDKKSDFCIPIELLDEAKISEGSDIEIICTSGAIIIMKSELSDILPEELCQLFKHLGISLETVRSVIKNENIFDEK